MFTINDTRKAKGLAVLLLVFHHVYRTTESISNAGVRLRFLEAGTVSQLAFCARICVYMFVFLSGYGLAYIYKNKVEANNCSTFKFILRQWLKVLFPYWFSLMLLWALWIVLPNVSIVGQYGEEHTLLYILGDFFSILDLIGEGAHMFRGVFWYMNFSLVLIVVLPLLYHFVDLMKWAIIPITIFTFSYIPVAYNSNYGGDYRWYIFAMEAGILFYYNDVFTKIDKYWRGCSAVIKMVLIIALLCISVIGPWMAWFVIKSSQLGGAPFMHTLGAIAAVLVSFLIRIPIIEKVLCFVGTYSGEIYITHWLFYSVFIDLIKVTDILIVQYIWVLVLSLSLGCLIGFFKKVLKYNNMYNWLINKYIK